MKNNVENYDRLEEGKKKDQICSEETINLHLFISKLRHKNNLLIIRMFLLYYMG